MLQVWYIALHRQVGSSIWAENVGEEFRKQTDYISIVFIHTETRARARSFSCLYSGVLQPFFPYQISILLLLHVAAKVLHGDGFLVLGTNGFALLRLRLSLSFFLHSGEKRLVAGDSLLGLVLLVFGIVTVPQGSRGLKCALYNSTFLRGSH